MTTKQKTLVGGVSILGVAGIICKIVGVLYRIPLAHLIGPEGMGVYHKVYPAYNLLLTISSAEANTRYSLPYSPFSLSACSGIRSYSPAQVMPFP